MNDTMTTNSPDEACAAMVERILADRPTLPERIARAMRHVPRHLFVPAASITEAYAEQAVITKRVADGAALSCASTPGIVAMMLDQLAVRPGDRILEIGAGTGYNAALLAELTGPAGQVVTVDIDPQVTAGARAHLDATGYGQVHVATRDGRLGVAEHAPYERIIVTVGAWDLPAAWWAQLVPGGRLVVPLRWRGQTRAVAFVGHGDRLVSDADELCGFVPMVGQDGERFGTIDHDGLVTLYWDRDQPLDPDLLRGVLDQPRSEAWSTVTVGNQEPFDGIWLRLTATEPGICRLAADRAAVEAGLCDPIIPIRTPALAEADCLAYLAIRDARDNTGLGELGAYGHGPRGAELADRLCDQIHAWDTNRAATPALTAYPANTPDDQLDTGFVIDKPETRLVLTGGRGRAHR